MENNFLLYIFASFPFTFFLFKVYVQIANEKKIIAQINFRSSHSAPIPTGSGIIISFSSLLFYFFYENQISFYPFLALTLSIYGLFDDIRGFDALKKFSFQILASIIFFINIIYFDEFSVSFYLFPIFVVFFLVCINGYNFIDGIDGMATLTGIYVSVSYIIIMYLSNYYQNINSFIYFLIITSIVFYLFNYSPAKLFMGDAGSIFYASVFCVLIFESVIKDFFSLFTWLILLSYYISDLSYTFLYRFINYKNWYKPHRSHPYQKLAIYLKNHNKAVLIIITYNILIALPLAILSSNYKQFAFFIFIFSLIIPLLISIKFGPTKNELNE